MSDAAGRKGSLGGVEISLAQWLDPPDRYQRRYLPINPQAETVSSDEPGFTAEPRVRTWFIGSWRGGEDEDRWDRETAGYREADGLVPLRRGDGLELGRLAETMVNFTGGADFTGGGILGIGKGSGSSGVLWSVIDQTAYFRVADDPPSSWGSGITTGAPAGWVCRAVADPGDGWMYSVHRNTTTRVYRWTAASNELHVGSGVLPHANEPSIVAFGGRLFALAKDDLYEIDLTAADTVTQVADVVGTGLSSPSTVPWDFPWLAASDKGPIWIQYHPNGQVFIHQYNVALDVQEIIGKLPVDFTVPYSIYFAHGIVFVGFRYADDHARAGDAFVYFFRAGQSGVAGPFRSSGTASKPVLIGGVIGDDLIVYFDSRVWAYNLSEGSISVIANQVLSGTGESIITLGQEIFLSGGLDSDKVETYRSDKYTASGTLATGRHDFDYHGLQKRLIEVAAITDPLAAGTSVEMGVSVDGGAVQALTGAHDGDGSRRFSWAADLVGYEFELEVTGATTDDDESPIIRGLAASVTGAAHRVEWVLGVDCSDMSHKMIDDLQSLVAGSVITFTDPWQNRESDPPDTFQVVVQELLMPEIRDGDTPDEIAGRIRLLSRDLVSGTGAS